MGIAADQIPDESLSAGAVEHIGANDTGRIAEPCCTNIVAQANQSIELGLRQGQVVRAHEAIECFLGILCQMILQQSLSTGGRNAGRIEILVGNHGTITDVPFASMLIGLRAEALQIFNHGDTRITGLHGGSGSGENGGGHQSNQQHSCQDETKNSLHHNTLTPFLLCKYPNYNTAVYKLQPLF